MSKYIPITPEGFAAFKEEKIQLLIKRKTAVVNLRTAREMGDLSENAAYKVARHELSAIDSRLRHLEYIIRVAKVVEKTDSDLVDIGSNVVLQSLGDTQGKGIVEYLLVGGYESDPAQGKISHYSPIGRAIIGRKTGDEIKVNTPKGLVNYKIIEVK